MDDQMTGTGWRIGELPDEYGESDIEAHPVPGLKVVAGN